MTPTKEDLKVFIKEVHAMSLFEAEHRNLRGWDLYKPENVPIPAVMTVMKWLNEIVDEHVDVPSVTSPANVDRLWNAY